MKVDDEFRLLIFGDFRLFRKNSIFSEIYEILEYIKVWYNYR